MDLGALSASGVLRLHDHPYLRLKGAGTLVAVIDCRDRLISIRLFVMVIKSKTPEHLADQSLTGGRTERIPYGRRLHENSDQRGACRRESTRDRALNRSERARHQACRDSRRKPDPGRKFFRSRHRRQNWCISSKLEPAKKISAGFLSSAKLRRKFFRKMTLCWRFLTLPAVCSRKPETAFYLYRAWNQHGRAQSGDGPLSEFIEQHGKFQREFHFDRGRK